MQVVIRVTKVAEEDSAPCKNVLLSRATLKGSCWRTKDSQLKLPPFQATFQIPNIGKTIVAVARLVARVLAEKLLLSQEALQGGRGM